MENETKPKVIIVMPAYNAATTLEKTVKDIPQGFVDEIILVDDSSQDDTVRIAKTLGLTTMVHSGNMGYGANQKTCYDEALRRGAEIVIMIHPDYQYDSSVASLFCGDHWKRRLRHHLGFSGPNTERVSWFRDAPL